MVEDPKAARFEPLTRALRAAVLLALVLSLATLVAPSAGDVTGAALVALLVAAPLLRVGWFVQRWYRRGDPRFALVGTAVLSVVAIGALIAWWHPG